MKFFWKYVRNKLRSMEDCESKCVSISTSSGLDTGHQVDNPKLNFTVMSAEGGTIVSHTYFDSKKGDYRTRHTVIPENDNMQDAIAGMITMAMMRL